LFFFRRLSSSRLGKEEGSREKKRLNALLSSSSSPRKRRCFSRARANYDDYDYYSFKPRRLIVRDLGSISEEFCARARERSSPLHRERENKKKTAEKRERTFSSSLFALFLCFSYKSKAFEIHRVAQKVWL